MTYLEQELVVCAGETLSGTLSMKPNLTNHRDVDIAITLEFDGQHGECSAEQQYRLR